MKKVVVVGSGGSGKSTFSRKLGEKIGLPVVHLDSLYWQPNWTKMPEDEWLQTVQRQIERDEWIMDGNFGGTRAMRMQAADTVIVLDLPRYLCMYRIVKRMIVHFGRRRPDMAEGCYERFDWEFLMWVWNYCRTSRVRLFAELEALGGKEIIVLTSRAEVDNFLRNAS